MVGGSQLLNDMECPYLFALDRFEVVPSINVLAAVSIIHECGTSCELQHGSITIERQQISTAGAKTLKHDKTNNLYVLNLYSVC